MGIKPTVSPVANLAEYLINGAKPIRSRRFDARHKVNNGQLVLAATNPLLPKASTFMKDWEDQPSILAKQRNFW